VDGLTQQPIVRRGWQSHRRVIGILEPRRLLDLGEKPVAELTHTPKLPPLQDDQVP